ncbi:MAG: hypothetical protein RPR40_13945 [Bermanella sp.]
MISLACVILVLCMLLLMINFAVGPFVSEPWSRLPVAFAALPPLAKRLITLLSLVGVLICSLIIIGFTP